jgi:CubicO group peptidase (beta-lactamase class C family)
VNFADFILRMLALTGRSVDSFKQAGEEKSCSRKSRLHLFQNRVHSALTKRRASPSVPHMSKGKPCALSDAISRANEIVQTEWAAKVPGLCVAVAVDGATVWSQAFGYADLEKQTAVTPATRFRIGSVSKPLTAAGLALLVERGQLDLDAPVQKYIPDFPQKDGLITTRRLAGHLTGIRNYRGTETISNKPFPNLRSGLKIFEDDPLEAAPGTKFSYCSYNWNVIGVVMEAAAKQDFLSYMEDNVFKPLGLSNTRPDLAGVSDPQRAQFYETDPAGKFFAAPAVNLSFVWPAGGFLSTAEDLIRFGSAHLKRGFLKPESLRLLFTSQKTDTGIPTHYGVGWFAGRGVLHHGGDSIGGTSVLLLHPASRTVVAIASNGGQIVLRNALRRGKATEEAGKLLFNKAAIAHKIAKAFSVVAAT